VREILLDAEEFGTDLIAMTARRNHPLTRLVLGTTADQVCRRADAPVVLYRAAPRRC
jgi:nucleotide-binding universal stress UspA family protein